jgi:hypothetical protein
MACRLPGVHFYDLPRVNRQADRVYRRDIDDIDVLQRQVTPTLSFQ